MPSSMMTLFPQAVNILKGYEIPLQAGADVANTMSNSVKLGCGLIKNTIDAALQMSTDALTPLDPGSHGLTDTFQGIYQRGVHQMLDFVEKEVTQSLDQFNRERKGELDFIDTFTGETPDQDWSFAYEDADVLLDLPGFRLIDISTKGPHEIRNYAVVFAPRAGHHSNIAERTALFLRDHGLTRIAVVEQKCADDIPLYVEGRRHFEHFDGQVTQYTEILRHLKILTGHAPHLIAVCQPGPLLISTLILNPDLARTFGSAGSPMHTEAEKGFLTDFARTMGENYIDTLIKVFSSTVSGDKIGAGREMYDGRLQVLGFYYLGMDQHLRNLNKLLSDFRQGDVEEAERQKSFYQWYNRVFHFPAGFIRDTFKKIFVNNELINGNLVIHDQTVGIENYPSSVPIWALGGEKDNIAPPLQATGHMDLIHSVPEEKKLTLIADAGHMGLFRSSRVLKDYYGKIVDFILTNSDLANSDRA